MATRSKIVFIYKIEKSITYSSQIMSNMLSYMELNKWYVIRPLTKLTIIKEKSVQFIINQTINILAIHVKLDPEAPQYLYKVEKKSKSSSIYWIVQIPHKNGLDHNEFKQSLLNFVSNYYSRPPFKITPTLENIETFSHVWKKGNRYLKVIKEQLDIKINNLSDIMLIFPDVKHIKYPYISHLDQLQSISNILKNERHKLISLTIDKYHYDANNFIHICDAISTNKSLKKINLSNISILYESVEMRTKFIKSLAESIKQHPCLKSLEISYNDHFLDTSELIRSLPKSITNLNISHNTMTLEDIECLTKNTNLRSISLNKTYFLDKFENIETLILTSRSLLEVDKHNYDNDLPVCIDCVFKKFLSKNSPQIKQHLIMLRDNRRARSLAINAAVCLILIRKLRRQQCGLLGYVPNELVHFMAYQIADSYIEAVWRIDSK